MSKVTSSGNLRASAEGRKMLKKASIRKLTSISKTAENNFFSGRNGMENKLLKE
jgi:hypothetical protein